MKLKMKPKTKQAKNHRKDLPPHSWEAHPSANQGEANKQLIIAVITIGAIIVLGILLFFSDRIIGKAFYAGAENTAGIKEVLPLAIGEQSTLEIMAKLGAGKETVAIELELNLPKELKCENIDYEEFLGWNEDNGAVFEEISCLGDEAFIIKYATLDWTMAKSGEFTIAKIYLPGFAAAGTYKFSFNYFNVYDLELPNADLITEGMEAEIVVEEAEAVEECGNGILNDGENCLTCPADVQCAAGTACSDAGECIPEQLLCTPNQYFCSDKDTVVRCNPDGKAYTESTDCGANELCEEGTCVAIGCQSDADCSVGLTCAAGECVQLEPLPAFECEIDSDCAEDEACQDKACVKKVPAAICTDTDAGTDTGINYLEKGIASDGIITVTDSCKSATVLTENFCLNNLLQAQDVDCSSLINSNYICTDGACVAKAQPIVPVKVELLTPGDLAVAADAVLTLGSDYKVKVTVSPLSEDLAQHIVIVQVGYNNQPNTYIYENKANLSVGEEETVEFAHEIAGIGEMKIEAFIWGNWPSAGTGNALLDKVEVKYEIK